MGLLKTVLYLPVIISSFGHLLDMLYDVSD